MTDLGSGRVQEYRGAAGFAGEDAAGLLLRHVEVLLVGDVDVLGQGLQVRPAGILVTLVAVLTSQQSSHQLLLLSLWHPSVPDGCGQDQGHEWQNLNHVPHNISGQ